MPENPPTSNGNRAKPFFCSNEGSLLTPLLPPSPQPPSQPPSPSLFAPTQPMTRRDASLTRGTGSFSRGFSWLILPPALSLFLFFVVPLTLVLAVSFASRGTYGGVEWTGTL